VIGADVVEGRERPLAGNKLSHDLESFAEAVQDVEHQGVVLDGLAKVGERVGEALHLAAIVVDGEGALGERAELGVDDHGARRAVVEELLLKAEPGDPGSDTVAVMDDIEQVSEMVLNSQDTTTQSIRVQAGSGRGGASPRTWSCKASGRG
jgi:hypothetical protein